MSTKHNLDQVKERIKEYLPQYLASFGIQVDTGRTFKCINPDHDDSNPSCGIVAATGNQVFHCFGCAAVGDIFTAASFLEGKPASGRGFVTDNLLYLARRFGVDCPELELSDDDLYEMETYQAYAHASQVIKHSVLPEIVKVKLTEYGWTRETTSKLGIGSVTSYEDYLHKMTKHHGHKLEFLREADLTSKLLFNPDNLIFTVKDEHGAPVGFAARSLKFEEDWKDYNKKREKIIAAEGEDSKKLNELFKPSKFVNSETKTKNRIYQKSKRLFNFDVAKKFTPPIHVVEGYADCATMFNSGIKNVAAIGSTSFTKEHLELILNSGIKHIIFILDADKGGVEGTERFVKLLEECLGGHIGLRVEIVVMPEGTDDPDSFIRKYPTLVNGAAEFRKLEKIDLFSWQMKKAILKGEDPLELSNRAIPLIINEPNNLYRLAMTKKLAAQTGLPEDALWREVTRLLDKEETRLNEERSLIANRTATELRRDPENLESVLHSAQSQIEMVEKRRRGYDAQNILKSVEFIFTKAETQKSQVELSTGFACLDLALGGLPREQKFLGMPGKPNQGKSSFLDNLSWRLIENNPDTMVLYHTADDSVFDRTCRLLGSKYKVPSKYFEKAGFYMDKIEGFEDIYNHSQNWLRKMAEEELLIIADVELLPPTLPALEGWIKTLRHKFPARALIVMGDNFHIYDLPGTGSGEEKIRSMSMYIKSMVNNHHCTGIFTMELPKPALRPGFRPRLRNIKGSSGIPYDLNCNLGVYNDLKDMEEAATIYWTDPKDQEMVIGPGGEESYVPKKKPVIELVIDKSKISSFDGILYFRFDPDSGRLEECSESEQALFRRKSSEGIARNNQEESREELRHSHAPYRGF